MKSKNQNRINKLRRDRDKVLRAFDVYKTNCSFGIDKRHEDVLDWYHKCLDLDKEAIYNVPIYIYKYIFIAPGEYNPFKMKE